MSLSLSWNLHLVWTGFNLILLFPSFFRILDDQNDDHRRFLLRLLLASLQSAAGTCLSHDKISAISFQFVSWHIDTYKGDRRALPGNLELDENQLRRFRVPLASHVSFGLQSYYLLLFQLKVQTGRTHVSPCHTYKWPPFSTTLSAI